MTNWAALHYHIADIRALDVHRVGPAYHHKLHADRALELLRALVKHVGSTLRYVRVGGDDWDCYRDGEVYGTSPYIGRKD